LDDLDGSLNYEIFFPIFYYYLYEIRGDSRMYFAETLPDYKFRFMVYIFPLADPAQEDFEDIEECLLPSHFDADDKDVNAIPLLL
jgi:hypothetical protein